MGDKLERRLRLQDEIRQRLKGVCSELPAAEFQVLIEQIADNTLKSDARTCLFRMKPLTH